MTIYIIIILLLIVLNGIFDNANKKIYFWCMVIALTVISAIRYNIGTDYIGYTIIFAMIKNGIRTYVENGYYFIAKTVINMGGPVQVMFALMALFTIPAFGYTIAKNVKSEYRLFILLIFVCSTIYFGTMNAMRQYVAIAIMLFGFESLKNKKYIRYVIYIVLAMQFHSSSVCMIVYMILVMINEKVDILNIICVTIIISLLFILIDIRPVVERLVNVMPERWRVYLEGDSVRHFFEDRNASAIFKTIIPNIIWFLAYYFRKRIDNKYVDLYLIGFALYVFLNNAFYGINVFIRVYTMFEYYALYLLPLIIDMGKTKSDRTALKIFLGIYYIALTSYAIFYKNGNGVIPYDTIFGKGLF